jgi:hypothetical protein
VQPEERSMPGRSVRASFASRKMLGDEEAQHRLGDALGVVIDDPHPPPGAAVGAEDGEDDGGEGDGGEGDGEPASELDEFGGQGYSLAEIGIDFSSAFDDDDDDDDAGAGAAAFADDGAEAGAEDADGDSLGPMGSSGGGFRRGGGRRNGSATARTYGTGGGMGTARQGLPGRAHLQPADSSGDRRSSSTRGLLLSAGGMLSSRAPTSGAMLSSRIGRVGRGGHGPGASSDAALARESRTGGGGAAGRLERGGNPSELPSWASGTTERAGGAQLKSTMGNARYCI